MHISQSASYDSVVVTFAANPSSHLHIHNVGYHCLLNSNIKKMTRSCVTDVLLFLGKCRHGSVHVQNAAVATCMERRLGQILLTISLRNWEQFKQTTAFSCKALNVSAVAHWQILMKYKSNELISGGVFCSAILVKH